MQVASGVGHHQPRLFYSYAADPQFLMRFLITQHPSRIGKLRNASMKPGFLAEAKKDYAGKCKASRKMPGLTAAQGQAELEEFGIGTIPNHADAFFNEDANNIVRSMFDLALKNIVNDPLQADPQSVYHHRPG